jgi:phosphate transport system permease protein
LGNFLFHLRSDKWVSWGLGLLASFSVGLLALIFLFLGLESWPSLIEGGWLRFIGSFGKDGWYPLEGKYEIAPMVVATLVVSLGAILIAAPLGIASAVFIRFFASAKLAQVYLSMVALLAGIPSVVFGLWGLTNLVPIIGEWQPPGTSAFAAMLVLAVMILPTITLTSAAALKSVPKSWLIGAQALALSRRSVVLGVALPAARQGIASGILLAMARALGETMAVVMVAGNVVQLPSSVFDSVRVLTANIALEMAYATGVHRASLFASGLLLAIFAMILAFLAARDVRSNAMLNHV